MKNRFDFEQEVLGVWNIISDLRTLNEGILEHNLSPDQISNIVLGMEELYELKFTILFDTFEQMIRQGKI